MAFIFYTDGEIQPPFLSPAISRVYFDSHTNPSLYSEVYSDPTAYSVIDGVLVKDGSPVVINPPCVDCQTIAAVLEADGEATVVQLTAAVKLLLEKPGFTRG